MAKKAMMDKEAKRERLVAAGKYPAVRLHNRCSICGRPHGYHRDFGLCRICLRKMAHEGLFSCVGCGRCLESCPVNMNVVKVIKAVQEADDIGGDK